jgi:hypothetical protein
MLNPLVDSLADLNLMQLEDKIVELQRKYFMTRNPGLQAQIANILEIYKEELYTRRAIEAQRQKDQDGNNSLDSLINIS